MRRAPFVLPVRLVFSVRPIFSGFLPRTGNSRHRPVLVFSHTGNSRHRPVLVFSRTGTLWSHISHNPHQSHKPHFHLLQGEMT